MGKILYYFENYKKIKCSIPKNLLDDINNKGIIFVTPHLGMYTNGKNLGYFLDKNIFIVHQKLKIKIINNLAFPNNFYKKCNYILKGKSFNNLLNIKGGCICLACDQKAHNNQEKYQNLHQTLYFHTGPA